MRNYILIVLSLATGLLSGCSQNDYDGDSVNGKDSSSGSMSISASLPSLTTRVTETADAVKGLITAWESTDVLKVFHKYTKNSTVGAIQGFEFTSTAAGSSSTFAYSGASEYSFTPSYSLYAFNALPTASNYTQTYNSSNDNFTLSLSGYAAQDGTVTNLRNYDAMYGTSTVNAGGTPDAMGMNHLMSVLRFDLTNADFTGTWTSVTFAYTASSGSSLLPATGNFTLSNTSSNPDVPPSGPGEEISENTSMVTSGTLTGATSWTVSNVAASSGTAPVYLMTFPDTRSGTLTITATASDGNTYYRAITLNAFALTSGSMKAYKVTLNKQIKYYMWDATAVYPATYNANMSMSGVATNSCKDCPTYDQIQMYIGAGTYWDNTTSWKDGFGTAHTGGLWLKKKAYITGFDAGTATKVESTTPTAGVPTNTDEYFFLPTSGRISSGTTLNVGSIGYYWSPTIYPDNTAFVYYLAFSSSYVGAYFAHRDYGHCLWSVQ